MALLKRKYTRYCVQDLRDFAAGKNGECLSPNYQGSHTKHRWKCSKGHEWTATPNQIINKMTWCPLCSYEQMKVFTYTIGDMRQAAAKHGGKCLSPEYLGTHVKLLWECREGHRWQTTPHSILIHGTWCPECVFKSLRDAYEMTRRPEKEAVKGRILALLKERPLRNAEIQASTHLGRNQVYRLMRELSAESLVLQQGYGQSARWHAKERMIQTGEAAPATRVEAMHLGATHNPAFNSLEFE